MTRINGVHALLAFLVQQAQSAKQLSGQKPEVKQLQQLLEESRLQHERLLKIERALASTSQSELTNIENDPHLPLKPEGSWPAASVVQDAINRQERQHAYGNWPTNEIKRTETEPFFHREIAEEKDTLQREEKQILIQRFQPSEQDILTSTISTNFGPRSEFTQHLNRSLSEVDNPGRPEATANVLLVAVGIALLLATLIGLAS